MFQPGLNNEKQNLTIPPVHLLYADFNTLVDTSSSATTNVTNPLLFLETPKITGCGLGHW